MVIILIIVGSIARRGHQQAQDAVRLSDRPMFFYGETPAKMRGVLDRVQRNGKHLLGLILWDVVRGRDDQFFPRSRARCPHDLHGFFGIAGSQFNQDHGEFDQGSVGGCRARRARRGVRLVYGADFQRRKASPGGSFGGLQGATHR
jgi:hypothetical protein